MIPRKATGPCASSISIEDFDPDFGLRLHFLIIYQREISHFAAYRRSYQLPSTVLGVVPDQHILPLPLNTLLTYIYFKSNSILLPLNCQLLYKVNYLPLILKIVLVIQRSPRPADDVGISTVNLTIPSPDAP